jgi:hypothetical protein
MLDYTGGNPSFGVTVPPVTSERAFTSIYVICLFLVRLDLDLMRTALSKKGYARGISRRRGPCQMDVIMMTDPLDFGIFIGFHNGANIVRISPEAFNRTNEQQELIYQKCVGMLEIFSTAPIGTHAKPIAVDQLHFRLNKTEAERKQWEELLLRWKQPT